MNNMKETVKSINPCKSVMQTIYDIVKAHGGVTIAIGMKVETKEEGSIFIINLPIQ
jgi:hypothetical protein